MVKRLRVGLVLTGGGARAAYQVGVVRALSQFPVDVAAVSAVGAGALNGLIVAASSTTEEAAQRLEALWAATVLSPSAALRVGPLPVLKLGVFLTVLFGAGVQPAFPEIHQFMQMGRNGTNRTENTVHLLKTVSEWMNVSTNKSLEHYLSSVLQALVCRLVHPFFVSVYKTDSGILEMAKFGLTALGLIKADGHEFIEVSDPKRPTEERLRAVLASATLPFISSSTPIEGHRYIDGSFGGLKPIGKVPLTPLRNQTHVDVVIVIHTESGVAWNSNDFRDIPILELRPSVSAKEADVGYFWADAPALNRWIATGECDAKQAISALISSLEGWEHAAEERDRLRRAARTLDE